MDRPTRRLVGLLPLALGLALPYAPASAQLTQYYSIDAAETATGPHTAYNAKEAQFVSDTHAFQIITFEGLPTGPFNDPTAKETPSSVTLSLGQGVTADLNSVDPRPPSPIAPDTTPYIYGITSDHPSTFTGFNVTTEGSQFLRFVPSLQTTTADVTFKFTQPVASFGLALTGLGGQVPEDLHLIFTPKGGIQQDISIPGSIRGGLVFFGVGGLAPTTQFKLEMRNVTAGTRDIIGIDDVRFTPIPEPSSLVMIALGSIAVLAYRLKRPPRCDPGRRS